MLHQNGKTISQLSKEYGITWSAIDNWVKQYSEVKIDNDTTLTAIHFLRKHHNIKLLCKVLHVNRCTYYKHYHCAPYCRTLANIDIKSKILQTYAASDMRLGAQKIRIILASEYGIKISIQRLYRLINSMNLPKMSTVKPKYKNLLISGDNCSNHLHQGFNQDKPNLVWVSDITYIKVSSKFYYLCVIIDLFARKVIAY